MLLDKKLAFIKSGLTSEIVHKNAKPSPPNGKPVTMMPKNAITITFQTLDSDIAAEPNKQIKMRIA